MTVSRRGLYIKGVKKERRIVNAARNAGHIAFRSAGSHGKIDCIVIDTAERTIRFVQCKPDSMSDNAKNKLLEESSNLNGSFFCKFEVV